MAAGTTLFVSSRPGHDRDLTATVISTLTPDATLTPALTSTLTHTLTPTAT